MTYAQWLAAHVNKWGHPPSPGEAWEFAERQALERAIRATAHAKTTSHACDAIRALIESGSSVASKEG